jgi:hypothetical protein
MFNTKTRNTIMALVASFSFAGAALVPAVSLAEPAGEGTKVGEGTKDQVCKGLHAFYEIDEASARRALEQHDNAGIKKWAKEAGEDRQMAKEKGCKWAGRELPERPLPTAPKPEGSVPGTEGTPPSNSTKPIGSPPPLA